MKFKMFSILHIGFGKIAGNVLYWYVVKYTLDDIKHNETLHLISKSITRSLCRFSNWVLDKTIENETEEFRVYRQEFSRKYFD